jgi:hypothetical protein
MNGTFQDFLNRLTQSGKLLFLLDGTGALLSTFSLGVVLRQMEPVFGMPGEPLTLLTLIAAAFACYSWSCYFLVKDKWPAYLQVIMVANALYALLSLSLVCLYFEALTALGVTYFVLELIVLAAVVYVEYRAVQKTRLIA